MAQIEIKPTPTWKAIYDEVVKISRYEGRQAVSPSGESDYSNVLITDQDKDLIKLYIAQSISAAEESLSGLVYSITHHDTDGDDELGETDGNYTEFKFVVDGARVSQSMLAKMVTEAIASNVMCLWLSERKSSRVEFYTSLYKQMISSIKTRLTRKSKPSLDITY